MAFNPDKAYFMFRGDVKVTFPEVSILFITEIPGYPVLKPTFLNGSYNIRRV